LRHERNKKGRDEGEDNELKTRGSKRMIKLYRTSSTCSSAAVPPRAVHPEPDDFFFTGPGSAPHFVPDGPV
jgi:hypothetical protein